MIVVTTPTGNIGSKLLTYLLESNEPVRVIVRDASRLPADLRERVDNVEGSHADPAIVDKAFQGADSVFWLAPPRHQIENLEAAYLDFTRSACEAFRTHGVQRVVAVSNLGRGTPWQNQAGVVTVCLQMCDLIAASGVHLRALALPGFMDNFLQQAGTLKAQGMFFNPLPGDQPYPICSTGDIAQVAARLLVDHTWTGVSDYPVLGPEDLSLNEMAGILTEVLGKPIRFKQVPFDAFRAQLLGHGMSEVFANALTEMFEAKAKGLDNGAPRTPESTTPTTFRRWAEQYLKPAVLN
jgi:uncharacterized protein YbjT (DUF2867 family)